MTILLTIAVTLAVLAFTLMIRESDLPEPLPVSPVQYLEDRKAAIYENLRDLQFEFRVGKLSDADYQQTKLNLQKELAAVIGEIEKTPTQAAATPSKPAPKTKPGVVCPHCKATFAKPMKFCGECGKAMS